MINMFNWQINTCIEELENQIRKEDMEECYRFIDGRRETRHQKTQKRHLEKFSRLCHRNTGGCSNHTHISNDSGIGTGGHPNQNTEMALTQHQPNNSMSEPTQEYNNNHNWVRNLSRRPLTKAQEKILSHGPNYAIVTKKPPMEYTAQVERVCQSLTHGEAEDLRAEVKSIMKENQATKVQHLQRRGKGYEELKKDQDRMV